MPMKAPQVIGGADAWQGTVKSAVSIELNISRREHSLRPTGPGGECYQREFCYQESSAAVDLVQTAMLTSAEIEISRM